MFCLSGETHSAGGTVHGEKPVHGGMFIYGYNLFTIENNLPGENLLQRKTKFTGRKPIHGGNRFSVHGKNHPRGKTIHGEKLVHPEENQSMGENNSSGKTNLRGNQFIGKIIHQEKTIRGKKPIRLETYSLGNLFTGRKLIYLGKRS